MKLVQTQKTIENALAAAPLEDLEVENALNDYLNFRGTTEYISYRPRALSASQIDLLLQKMLAIGRHDASFTGSVGNYVSMHINSSIRAGNDQFILHTGDVPMDHVLGGVGTFSIRPRITVHGNMGYYFASGACNVDVTVYGDCVDVGSYARQSSFVVHGNITDAAIFRSVSTRLIAHGSVNGSVAREAHHFDAEIHDAAGAWSGYGAKHGVLTLHGSYGRYLGESAENCTFRLKKKHHHGKIGQPESLIDRLFRRNKVVFI